MNHLGSSGDVIQWLMVDKSGPMDPEDGFGRPPFLLCYASFQVFFRFFGANLRASSCSKDQSHGEHGNMYSEIIGIVLSFLCWWVLGWVFFEILLYFIKLHNKYTYIYYKPNNCVIASKPMRPMTSTRAPWHLGCNFKVVQNSDQLDPVGRWKLHRALNTAPFLVAKKKNLDIKISKSAHFFLPTHQISKTKNTVFFVQRKRVPELHQGQLDASLRVLPLGHGSQLHTWRLSMGVEWWSFLAC